MSNVRQTVTALDSALTEVTDRLARLAERAERVDAQLARSERRLARGTIDGDPVAVAAPPPAPERPAKPALNCFVGDSGPTAELRAAIERAIRATPATLRELVAMTGARQDRISGALVKLQLAGLPILNLGTTRRARYYIPPTGGKTV